MKSEEHKWYHANHHGRNRLTGKRKRGYVKPVKVKSPEKYLNSKRRKP